MSATEDIVQIVDTSFAIEVDTTPLRSPTRGSVPSPPKVAAIQQRLESWSPRGTSNRSLCGKIDGAAARRAQIREQRTAALARRNLHAQEVAQRTKSRVAEAAVGQTAGLATKLLSAAKKRKAALSQLTSHAASHCEHVKGVAAEQRALKAQKNATHKQAMEQRVQAATRRVTAALATKKQNFTKQRTRAATAGSFRTEKRSALQDDALAKLAAAERRREALQSERLSQLQTAAERARQVRRNKGSTPHRSTAAAERTAAASLAPVAFDMAVRGALSPKKSPVQLRLEARLHDPPGLATPCLAAEAATAWGGDAAAKRRQALVDRRVDTLAKHNTRASAVAAAQRSSHATTAATAPGDPGARNDGATQRRLAFMEEKTTVAAKHNAHASAVAHKMSSERAAAVVAAAARLQSKLCNAEQRRHRPACPCAATEPAAAAAGAVAVAVAS